jgi:hypothetical protein
LAHFDLDQDVPPVQLPARHVLQPLPLAVNVETTFSMIKAKFRDSIRSKSEVGQFNEVLCKVIAHNLCVTKEPSRAADS